MDLDGIWRVNTQTCCQGDNGVHGFASGQRIGGYAQHSSGELGSFPTRPAGGVGCGELLKELRSASHR